LIEAEELSRVVFDELGASALVVTSIAIHLQLAFLATLSATARIKKYEELKQRLR
jgi:hypothetical protein